MKEKKEKVQIFKGDGRSIQISEARKKSQVYLWLQRKNRRTVVEPTTDYFSTKKEPSHETV